MPSGKAHISSKKHSGHTGSSSKSSKATAVGDQSGQGQATAECNPDTRTDDWMLEQALYGPYDAVGEVMVDENGNYYSTSHAKYPTPSIATQGSAEAKDDKGQSSKSHHHKGDHHKSHDHKNHGHKSHGSSSHAHAGGHKKSSGKK